MIEQLRGELDVVRYTIWVLEGVASGKPRRGRPPKGKHRMKPPGRRRVPSDEITKQAF
jgi:hypothetical protein